MALSYRRGVEEVTKAAEDRGSGFTPFVPRIEWQDADEVKSILVLTPPDEVGTFDLHEWIPVGKGEKADGETYTRYEVFLSRRDPFLDEDYDLIADDFGRKAKTRCVGVAVELEPVIETVNGRKRPVSFTVKTDTYTRKNEAGDEEEVIQPAIGLIVQSAQLMWGPLVGFNEEPTGPLGELPLQVTRRNKDKNTRYEFVPFMDMPVDLSPVVDYVDGIGYLRENLDDLIPAIEAAGDDELSQARVVAETLFDKRIMELCDAERYEDLMKDVDRIPNKFGDDFVRGGKAPATKKKRPSRPSRAKAEEAEVEEAPEEAVEEPKEDRFAALRARVEG